MRPQLAGRAPPRWPCPPRAPRPRASLPAEPASGSHPRRRDRAPDPAPPPSLSGSADGGRGPRELMAAARPPRPPGRDVPRCWAPLVCSPAYPRPLQGCAKVQVLNGFLVSALSLNPFRAWSLGQGACVARLSHLLLLRQCPPKLRGCGSGLSYLISSTPLRVSVS